MKIVLDLSDLVERGQLTPAEATRLKGLASANTSTVAINLLVGFGLAAVTAGIGAQIPSAVTAVMLGAILAVAGFGVRAAVPKTWDLLGEMCVVVGVLALCGGSVVLDSGSLRSILCGVLLMSGAAVVIHSGFLIALAVLALGACLGTSTDYSHALYTLSVEEPTTTIVVFGVVAMGAYMASLHLPAALERLALIAARVAVLSVNLGFWVGSLFGDDLSRLRVWFNHGAAIASDENAPLIPAAAFGFGWALALLAVGAWALRANRMWVVNTVAIFAALHFYTQWFERIGAHPLSVLGAGVLTLVLALALWRFNQQRALQPAAA